MTPFQGPGLDLLHPRGACAGSSGRRASLPSEDSLKRHMLLSYPICKAWACYLPNISFFGIPLNPGPFTIKEHVIITIMAGVGEVPAYAVSVAPTWQIISRSFCSVRALTIFFRPI